MVKHALAFLTGAGLAICGSMAVAPAASATPLGVTAAPGAPASLVTKAQVGVYVGVGRPWGGYYGGYYRPYPRPYYGHGYYGYRPYAYGPPPVTYYETRPYVVRPAAPPPAAYGYGDPDALARCASRFRSFNAHTGTYVTYDGEVRRCPFL